MSGSITLPLTAGPTYGPTSKTVGTRVRKTDFGDGYGQRVEDGINTVRAQWNVGWSSLTEAEKTAVDVFLAERKGTKYFLWTPPGEGSPLKWICSSWQIDPLDPGAYSFSAQFVQVFDL